MKIPSDTCFFKSALNEAWEATKGGLRFVLDVMTDQYKKEGQEKHVNHVLKTALDPKDWEAKKNFMLSALMKRLKHHLPHNVMECEPGRFAADYETIVRAYVNSVDSMREVFRSI